MMQMLPLGKAPGRPDLTGTVQTTNGQPVRGAVFISTAGPKAGTSPFCPSCYADCRKSARTDNDGNFKIESLDPDLRFRILVVGEGCEPKFVGKVDPAEGPIRVSLQPRDPSEMPLEKIVAGRVLNPHGAPIAGAAVEATGIRHKNGGTRWGALENTDPFAVTGAQGEFVLSSRKDFTSLDLKVAARGFANRTFTDVAAGGPSHDLRMTEGAAIQGRVTLDGKPLPNVSVGVVSEDRGIENFTGNFEAGTDAEGRFFFPNLPPNVRYQVYALMTSVKEHGATKSCIIDAGGDGTVMNTGDLAVVPANRISGRVVLEDANVIPDKTRLVVGRGDASDSQVIELEKDGSFKVEGVPTATISLSVSVDGYHPSVKNASLDPVNPFHLTGWVDRDVTNLVLLFDRGDPPESRGGFAESRLVQTDPLRGAEQAAQPVAPVRTDYGLAMMKEREPSDVLLGNQAGATQSGFVIEVPVPKSGGDQPDWGASENLRRSVLTKEFEPVESAPIASGASSGAPRPLMPSLALSDFAKFLSNPPWIKQITYAQWKENSIGGQPGTVESAKWVLETNLAAVQPGGFFEQNLTLNPGGPWAKAGEKRIFGMSENYFWHTYESVLHQLFLSPGPQQEGASDQNNPQRIAGWKEAHLQKIRHWGLPALRPNSLNWRDDGEFSATTRQGESLHGRILAADSVRPVALIYSVGGNASNVFRVDYRYRSTSTLPSYIELGNSGKDDAAHSRRVTMMVSITQIEYGSDPRISRGYEPSQFFLNIKVFNDIQFWKNGEQFAVAPNGRQVKIER
jgi:hypothetical protein